MQKVFLTLVLATLFGCANSPPMGIPFEELSPKECPKPADASQSFVLPDRGVQPPAREKAGLKGAWVVFKYAFWGQGRQEDLPWVE